MTLLLQAFLIVLGVLFGIGLALMMFGAGLMMLHDAVNEWGWWRK